jgi:hypothetical protein
MCGRHGDAFPLLRSRSQIAGKGCIVGIDVRLHSEVANLCLRPGFIVQTDVFKVADIREDGVVVRLVRGVEGRGLRGFRAGEVGRRAWHWRIDARMIVEGHRIFE